MLAAVYAQFFRLDKLPFRLRPDASFLHDGADFALARAKLQTGIRQRARVLLLLGRPGVGKTMLLDDVSRGLGADFALCRINQPRIAAPELFESLLLQIGPVGIEEPSRSRPLAEWLDRLGGIAPQAPSSLLIIDDAHLLPNATAQALLAVLDRVPSLQLILCGRSGMGLEEMAMRFLVNEQPRITRLQALNAPETRAYIEHRLLAAGAQRRELISSEAHALIFQHTEGSPRLINVLCDSALHAACLRASGQLATAEILAATEDPHWVEAVTRERSASLPENARQPIALAGEGKPAQLLVSLASEALFSWALPSGCVTIGRAPDNEFRLDTTFVSRHHCRITTHESVSTIEDLQSVNGIVVNGRAVKRHVLKHADQIKIGEHTLTYLFN